jgi:orotate phosphoribosyltransferase
MMVNTMTERQQLMKLLAERSVRRGHFVLASGKSSDLYVDARMTTMSPEGLALIGPMALEAVRSTNLKIDSVGGLTLGADPITYSIAVASYWRPPLIRAFSVRKDVKLHGTGKLIEGSFQAGDNVLVTEDVITTGASALKAINTIREAGGHIKAILALVDREDGGREAIEREGYSVICLFSLEEITAFVPALHESSDSADG